MGGAIDRRMGAEKMETVEKVHLRWEEIRKVSAALVSRLLEVRTVASISLSSYDGQVRGRVAIHEAPHLDGEGAGWIAIDDLSDTGCSAAAVRSLYPKICIATLYAKPSGAPFVDAYAEAVGQGSWLVFPWEEDWE